MNFHTWRKDHWSLGVEVSRDEYGWAVFLWLGRRVLRWLGNPSADPVRSA